VIRPGIGDRITPRDDDGALLPVLLSRATLEGATPLGGGREARDGVPRSAQLRPEILFHLSSFIMVTSHITVVCTPGCVKSPISGRREMEHSAPQSVSALAHWCHLFAYSAK